MTAVSGPLASPTQPSEAALRPPRVRGLHVYARYGGTCVLDEQGTASCWGWNREGRNGDGTLVDQLLPTPVSGGLTFASLAANDATTCGLTPAGRVYCWGADGVRWPWQTDYRLEPRLVTGADVFAFMSWSDWNGCGITTQAETKCWPVMLADVYTPQTVAGAPDLVTLAQGNDFQCGLTRRGEAFCWGYNSSGQVGSGSTDVSVATPTQIGGSLRFEAITGGFAHACALDRHGVAYCWGMNFFGSLGDGTTTNRNTPTPVATSLRFEKISGGNSHTCALTKDGTAYCWGSGWSGQLGNEVLGGTTEPTVSVAGELRFREISAGGVHTCGVTRDDEVYCWGNNSWGEIGDGTTTARTTPTKVQL